MPVREADRGSNSGRAGVVPERLRLNARLETPVANPMRNIRLVIDVIRLQVMLPIESIVVNRDQNSQIGAAVTRYESWR